MLQLSSVILPLVKFVVDNPDGFRSAPPPSGEIFSALSPATLQIFTVLMLVTNPAFSCDQSFAVQRLRSSFSAVCSVISQFRQQNARSVLSSSRLCFQRKIQRLKPSHILGKKLPERFLHRLKTSELVLFFQVRFLDQSPSESKVTFFFAICDWHLRCTSRLSALTLCVHSSSKNDEVSIT